MFPPMRRSRQSLPSSTCQVLLHRGLSGTLALSGEGDYPYAVPLSYAWDGERLYFHCAPQGHKLDLLARNNKASFCVIDQDEIVPEKFTTHFRSVIAFGTVAILTGEAARKPLQLLAEKYAPQVPQSMADAEIQGGLHRTVILEMTVTHLTGKEAIELVRARESQ